jgi:hypothetical protein
MTEYFSACVWPSAITFGKCGACGRSFMNPISVLRVGESESRFSAFSARRFGESGERSAKISP